MQRVNLLPQRCHDRSRKAVIGRITLRAGIACLIAGVFGTGIARSLMPIGRQIETIDIRLAETQVSDLRTRVKSMRASLTTEQREALLRERFQRRPDWSSLIHGLSASIGGTAAVSSLTVIPNGAAPEMDPMSISTYSIRIEAICRDSASVTSSLIALENMGCFDAVKLVDNNKVQFRGLEAHRFTVECELGGANQEGPTS